MDYFNCKKVVVLVCILLISSVIYVKRKDYVHYYRTPSYGKRIITKQEYRILPSYIQDSYERKTIKEEGMKFNGNSRVDEAN